MASNTNEVYTAFVNYMLQSKKLAELEKMDAEVTTDIENSKKFLKEIQEMYDNTVASDRIALNSVSAADDLARHDEISKILEADSPMLLLPDMEHLYDLDVDIKQTLQTVKSWLDKLTSCDIDTTGRSIPSCTKTLDVNCETDLELCSSSLEQFVKRLTTEKNIKRIENSENRIELEDKFQQLCNDVQHFTKIVQANSKIAQFNGKPSENDTSLKYIDLIQKLFDSINTISLLLQQKDCVVNSSGLSETTIGVVFVLTGHCNDLDRPHYKVYQRIAAASFGQVFNLNKTSVHNVLDFVRTSITGKAVNLGSAVNPRGFNYSKSIPVDSTLEEVTVSVSGAKPTIQIVDPRGEALTGPPKLITTLDLSEVMVVKVLQPEAGNWTISVGSEDSYSVKVAGLSNLTFHHGFSVHHPDAFSDTSLRPLQGAYNYMMIQLTELDRPVSVHTAEILNLEGRTLFEIPLKSLHDERKIYLADAFMPPEDLFFIAINGHDEYDQEFRRVGATTVQAKTPDVPFLTVTQDVTAHPHQRIALSCQIESLVPVTAVWTKDGRKVQPKVSSLQSTIIEYVIEDANETVSGTYRCLAENHAGISKAYTEVTLLVEPPQVTLLPENVTISLDHNFTLSCNVFSEALLWSPKLFHNGSLIENITIDNPSDGYYSFNKSMTAFENSSGLYTCEAENKGGKASRFTEIKVLTHPSAHILKTYAISNSIVELRCETKNAKRVLWLAPNGTVVFEEDLWSDKECVFRISKLSISDEGVWTCVAYNNDREARDKVKLNVTLKPEISIEDQEIVTLYYGTDYNISCKVLAKPEPGIFGWHSHNGVFFNTNIMETQEFIYTSLLMLKNVTGAMEMIYYCYAENSIGYDRKAISVRVRKNMTVVQAFTDQTVDLYSQVELNCIVDSYPSPHLRWYHNGTDLVTSDDIFISSDGSTVYVGNVDFSTLGMYECVAENRYETLEINGSLSVVDLETPVLSKEPQKIVTLKGKSTIVTCRLLQGKPKPKISWQHKPYKLATYTNIADDIETNNDGLELLITNVEVVHAGTYRCVAENVIGSDVYEIEILVQHPPQLNTEKVHQGTEPLEIKAGQKICFSCNVSGVPPPIIIWTKDNKPMAYTNNIYLTDENDLTIERTTEHDTGLFTCTATSSLGSIQRNFTLVVYVPPTINPPDLDPEIEVLEGQLVELPCFARGVPKPAIQWIQNGRAITEPRKYIDEDFVLRFVANLTDFGEYTCVATNKYGNSSHTFYIYIWVPPYLEPPLQSTMQIMSGDNATLQCDAVGFPVPIIVWEFQHQLLLDNTTDLSFNEYGSVYIRNASSEHDGIYTCIAESFVGQAKKTITLNVYEHPVILLEEYSGPYIATELDIALTISCRATGKPRPFVAWMKDGGFLDLGAHFAVNYLGSLTITALHEKLSGFYTCVASNAVGQANKTVEVQIYPSPKISQNETKHSKITIVEGTNRSIECPVQSTHNYTVKWYKNAKVISEGNLNFFNVSRDNASTYACTVKNAVSSVFCDVEIDVQWQPAFVTNAKSTVEVVKGDDYTFDCSTDAKPSAKTKWLFNSKTMFEEEKDRLKVLNINRYHNGAYKCVSSNPHGSITREFTMDVLEPPFISHFDMLDVQLKAGSSASLDCIAKGSPRPDMQWSFNNTNWHLQNGSLHTNNTSIETEGLFRCDAQNKAGKTHLIYRVQVVSKPAVSDIVVFDGRRGVTSVSENVEILLGSQTRIACNATGNPKPHIQWLRNGNTVANNSKVISYADLVIADAASTHAGLYSCVVSSAVGFDERIIQVNVLEAPKISTSLFQDTNSTTNNLEVLSGHTFYLHCHPYGNPIPQLYWFKDDVPLKLFDDKMVTIDFGEIIVANNALKEHSGNYTCVARNKVGESAFSYLVNVLAPPPKTKESAIKTTIKQTKQLKLRCPVQGVPLPSVVWVKQPYTEVSERLSNRIGLSEDNVTLTINNTQTTDSGKYSCIMTNKVGVTEVVYSVEIHRAPSIEGSKEITNTTVLGANIGRSVALNCVADGEPRPRVTWFKNAQPLSSSIHNIQTALEDNILTIWRISTRDAAQYVCVAENAAGIAHKRFNIIVSVPGKLTPWSSWSLCNVTCGLGYQRRVRSCQYSDEHVTIDAADNASAPFLVLDEAACRGAVRDRRKCHMPACEEEETEPRWSSWSKWSQCSATCGAGTQARTRKCKTKTYKCYGDNIQIKKCSSLPRCRPLDSANDVLHIREEITESDPYIPEATFEIQPFSSNYPDVDEFYVRSKTEATNVFDVDVGNKSSESGLCGPGYEVNNSTGQCEDIDECVEPTNLCHSTQSCTNLPGGYRCSCVPGYVALSAGLRCLDVNECEQETDGCEYACVNTAGGYVCACPSDLRLHADRHSCVDAFPNSYREQGIEEDYLGLTMDLPEGFMKNTRN